LRRAFVPIAVLAFLLFDATPGDASVFSRGRQRNNSKISLRKRLHINTLITEPGTAEVDWSNLYSFTSTNFSMPSAIKYTPSGSNIHVCAARLELCHPQRG